MNNYKEIIGKILALWMTGCGLLLIINWLDKGYEYICDYFGRGSIAQSSFTIIVCVFLPLGLGYLVNKVENPFGKDKNI